MPVSLSLQSCEYFRKDKGWKKINADSDEKKYNRMKGQNIITITTVFSQLVQTDSTHLQQAKCDPRQGTQYY